MNLHKIADLVIDMGYKHDRLKKQSEAYRISEKLKPDMTIYLSDVFVAQKQKENPHLELGDCEYIFTSSVFYTGLLQFGGLVLHASAVIMDGYAYLFSAPSGTGKSTHTALWQKVFGKDRVRILNDDKPAIRIFDDGVYAYGTPWSGKTDLNINVKAPIAGICFIERSEKNWIKQITAKESIMPIMNQTIRPYEKSDMSLLLQHLDNLLKRVPVYKMGCNMDDDAAITAHKKMSEGIIKNK